MCFNSLFCKITLVFVALSFFFSFRSFASPSSLQFFPRPAVSSCCRKKVDQKEREEEEKVQPAGDHGARGASCASGGSASEGTATTALDLDLCRGKRASRSSSSPARIRIRILGRTTTTKPKPEALQGRSVPRSARARERRRNEESSKCSR